MIEFKFSDTVVLNVILYSLQMQLQPELGIWIAPKAHEKWFGLSSYNIEITVDRAEISKKFRLRRAKKSSKNRLRRVVEIPASNNTVRTRTVTGQSVGTDLTEI